MNGMTTGVPLDGTQTCDTSASLFFTGRFGSWFHEQSEEISKGQDEPGQRSCSEHIPIELWSRWSMRWKILSDHVVEFGSFQGYDENSLFRSLSGRLAGVHKVLCSAADIACKGRQDFYLGHDGG